MSKDVSLHQRAHFRRIREAITEIAEYEGIDIGRYDLFNMSVYETDGENMKGKNVGYNISNGFSCWVRDNRYEVFEVPSKNNFPGSPYGEFVFFAYNSSFDYYLFGKLSISLDKEETIKTRYISEDVFFKLYGKYDITFDQRSNHIHKVQNGNSFDAGVRSSAHTFDFDSYNNRKRAYKADKYKILSALGVKGAQSGKLVGSNPVKVYRRKKIGNSKNAVAKLPKNLH
jgi:hypothetical protein